MFSGVFKPPSGARRLSSVPPATLERILRSKALQPHRFERNGEVGPFLVQYVCRERALILEESSRAAGAAKLQARTAFLMEMGYRVLQFSGRDLAHPAQVVAQIEAALRA